MDQVVRARGPGEIMNVFRVIGDGLGAVGVVSTAHFDPCGPYDFVLRHSQLHVVNTEVRKKLCEGMKLVAIPGAVPPNPNLGKPLAAQHKVAIPTGSLQGFRKLIVELDLELDVPIGWDRLWQVHLDYGAIVLVVVIW